MTTEPRLGVSFDVPIAAAPQGSKRHVGNGRLVESSAGVKPFREAVRVIAHHAMHGQPLFDGPVRVMATFRFARPKSHYRTGKHAHALRDDAPALHTIAPDLDKLQRALGDALTGIVIVDDSRIAEWFTVKHWGPDSDVYVHVTSLEHIRVRPIEAAS